MNDETNASTTGGADGDADGGGGGGPDGVETRGFQTEVKQLLELMVNSLYSNKEIFLRELVSNASDAADKLRFEALSNDALYEGEGDLKIFVDSNKEARTVTVRDNGVGMGYQEIIDNLGTIAKSGTRQFFDALTGDQAKDAQLIGQFGVGFYSCFIVADRVTVTSRRAGLPFEGGVRWESSGDGEYTVERTSVAARGTEVVLHLREGEDEFLESHRLRSIARKYSDHISLPIVATNEDPQDGESPQETINDARALWTRSKNEIEESEYYEFYKHTLHDYADPLAHVHSRVEGNLEYTALLFVPSHAQFDLWDRTVRRGVKLYVRRVFIMDDAEQLMPAYLRFVRGVIDCADLPLNISREILQQNRQIEQIRAGAVKRVLDLLSNLAKNDVEKYATFWSEFGKVLKEGTIEDEKNRETVGKLLRFATTSTKGDEAIASLDDYVSRMRPGQDTIYFLTADSLAAARSSPHLEVFLRDDIEVLLLTDEIDEWVVHHLTEYGDHKLQSVSKGSLDLSAIEGVERDEEDVDPAKHEQITARLKALLEDRVSDVRVTDRLTDSPACVVAGEHDLGGRLERLLSAAGQNVEAAQPILEINPSHALIEHLASETDDERSQDWAHLLFDQAVLAEGGRLTDPAAFVKRMNATFLALTSNRASPAKPAKKKTKRARAKPKNAPSKGE